MTNLLEVYREKPVKYGVTVIIVLRVIATISTIIGVEFYGGYETNILYHILGSPLFYIVTSLLSVASILSIVLFKKINDFGVRVFKVDIKLHYLAAELLALGALIDAVHDLAQIVCMLGIDVSIVFTITVPLLIENRYLLLPLFFTLVPVHFAYFTLVKKQKIFLHNFNKLR